MINIGLDIASETIQKVLHPVVFDRGELIIVRHLSSSAYRCAAYRLPQGEGCTLKSGTRGVILEPYSEKKRFYVVLVKNQKYKIDSDYLTHA